MSFVSRNHPAMIAGHVPGNVAKTAGSLFSGVGGLDLGTEAAGYRTAFQVEWDPHATAVLERHWPDVPRWSDVADVSGAELPPVDLITFGSPCQDLSVAGKRAGLAGAKSGLFLEAIRIIKEMRDATHNEFPRWVIWENVAGALSSNRGRDFASVLDHLADVGALVIEWAVLDAQWFGVPQRRRRVFVVACLDPATVDGCPDPLLPVAARRSRHLETSIDERPHVAALTACGVGTCGVDDNQAQAGHLIPFHLTQNPIVGDDTHTPALSTGGGAGQATIAVAIPQAFSENQRAEVILSDIAHQLSTGGGKPGQGYPAVLIPAGGAAYPLAMRGRAAGAELEMGEADVYNCLRAGDGGASLGGKVFTPEDAVRRLTPLECERLMGWPDDHTRFRSDGHQQADSHRYKQCGNGVATPVAAWLAAQLAGVDSRGPR